MRITPLTLDHEAALRRMLADFHAAGEDDIHGWFAEPTWTHAETVAAVAAWSLGEQLGDGWVPCTTLFLEEDGELLGLVNLRHHLNDFLRTYAGHVGYSVRPSARRRGVATRLLAAAVAEGRRLGIERFFLTCAADNVASIRTIERCGGVFEAEYHHDAAGGPVRSYWIVPEGP